MEEAVGFEPTVAFEDHFCFQDRPNKPDSGKPPYKLCSHSDRGVGERNNNAAVMIIHNEATAVRARAKVYARTALLLKNIDLGDLHTESYYHQRVRIRIMLCQ
jgi:hypothetical protein